jgi:hypothetical protein
MPASADCSHERERVEYSDVGCICGRSGFTAHYPRPTADRINPFHSLMLVATEKLVPAMIGIISCASLRLRFLVVAPPKIITA